MNSKFYNNKVVSISDRHSSIGFNKNKKNDNGNGGGGNDMEERIIKLEADVGSIKEIVKNHNNRFDKIDDKFEKFNDKLGEINKNFNNEINKNFNKLDDKLGEYNKQLFTMNGNLGEIKNQLTYTLTYKNLIKYTSSILALLIAFISIISAIAKYLLHLI
ncbi:BAR domain-containing protein [Commensalibacter melissae]|uniref:hypothetical protein n=1 Tax=Commensalibacter melissae TaxID=2070537 RepID=UPI0012D9F718|nr:hypothetical protein [Commensalibacter melissae]MUG09404.1 hypothetical protein [Commensalibacter melissae]